MPFIAKIGNFLFGQSTGVQTDNELTKNIADKVYYQGVEYLQKENYKEAQAHFKKASSLGHISAKYNLALMTFEGLGSYPDFELAKSLFEEADQAGHTRTGEFIDFMNDVDLVMSSGEDPSFSSYRDKFGELMTRAFMAIIAAPDKQVGRFVYLISRDVIRKIGDDQELAESFIKNEIGAMHLGNEVSEAYLKYLGVYDENFDWEDFENNFNEITMFLDHKVWLSITKASSGLLSLEQLVYARCCVINEVVKKYLYVYKGE